MAEAGVLPHGENGIWYVSLVISERKYKKSYKGKENTVILKN